jgi:hypothetical protein
MANEELEGNPLRQALLDPTSVFADPEAVVRAPDLTDEQKIEILRRWAYDARELQVAEEENMPGGPPSLLGRVQRALRALDAEVDLGHSPPTKAGGGE